MTAVRMLSLAQTQTVQVSIVIAVTALLTAVFFRHRPQVAYALWLLALIKCLTPPVWSSPTSVFSWIDVAREPAASKPAIVESHPVIPPTVAAAQSTAQTVEPVARSRAPAPRARVSPTTLLLGIWSIGAFCMLLVPLARSIKFRRSIGRDHLVRGLISGHSKVRVTVADEQMGPALVGIRPRIVVPRTMLRGFDTQLRLVVEHELMHLRRGDHIVALVQWIAQAIWWFHPLVWWMNRRLNATREASCDEQVIASTACKPADYAQMLLDVVKVRRSPQLLGPSLGIGATGISRRLQHIMDPTVRFHRRAPLAAWCAAALAGVLILPGAGLALHARQSTVPATTASTEDTRFHGVVVDHTTGKPVAGATVTIHRMTSIDGELKDFAPTEDVQTDEQGRYSFVLTAEQAKRWVLVKTEPRHPDYATYPPRAGHDIARLLREKKPGEEPNLRKSEMMPGEEVTGVIIDREDKPVADVPIKFTSIAGDFDKRFIALDYDRIDATTKTDANGRFRFNAIKGAKITDFWAAPDDYAVLFHSVRDQRGDLGTFRLRGGIKVQGQVLDVDGKPVSGISVFLESVERNDVNWGVNQRIARTDNSGHYALAPAKPGAYKLTVGMMWVLSDKGVIRYPQPPGAFVPQFLTVRNVEGKVEMSVDVRAVPHVTIRAKSVDETGKPAAAGSLVVDGRYNGEEMLIEGMPNDKRNEEQCIVPKGLTETKIHLNGARYRRGERGEFQKAKYLDLGTLTEDVTDLFVINSF